MSEDTFAITPPTEAPEAYKTAGMLMVISGLTNLMLGMIWGCMGLSMCVGTYGICFLCPLLGIVPFGIGVFEILEGNKMREGIWTPNLKAANIAGLVISVMSFHMIGVACEGFVMMQLGDPKVKAFLENPPA
jgi:hypothetical protein